MKNIIIFILLIIFTSCNLGDKKSSQKKYQDYFYDINKLTQPKVQIFKYHKNDSIEYYFTKIERLIKGTDTLYIQNNFNNYIKFDSLISKINENKTEIVGLYFFNGDSSEIITKAEMISGQTMPNDKFKTHQLLMNVKTPTGELMNFKGVLSLLKIENYQIENREVECMVMTSETNAYYKKNLLFSNIDTLYMAKGLGLIRKYSSSVGQNKLWEIEKVINFSDFDINDYKDYTLPNTVYN
ncbi:hypothetical protein QLS71_015345 [Mariniflexile litorale]|uniref:Lipoprotein n=1 Tax=Mariniflexile litorale TaxID=3045158 RepID=A0AAU7EEB3_9FLAO|nr:hypothetical protein [Mariniflexile sp. KMM 9835]MDQ8213582.1 hypothetical protein [Mariniflexile sp. KMM 9835]